MPMKSILARQILDCRGTPTVEVDLITDLGLFRASVPSGSTSGPYEAVEVRDGEANKFNGQSVYKAIDNINQIIGPQLLKSGLEVTQQTDIDDFILKLDGTENKCKLGVNAILPVSLVVCKAGAAKRGLPLYKHIADLAGVTKIILPVPLFNVLNGGRNAGNKLAFQEYLILPTGANSFSEAMKMGMEVYYQMKPLIQKKYGLNGLVLGDEGGFSPNVATNKDALTIINSAINKAGYAGRVNIAIDAAATEFFKNGKYNTDFKNPKAEKKPDPKKVLTSDKLRAQYNDLKKQFPAIVSIEDPFEQEQFEAWAAFKRVTELQIVGDSLTASNPKRISMAMENEACNCVLLKLNQVGTITEIIKVHQLAFENGWGTMVSHRLGETEDTFIADLSVGLSAGQIKAGAPCRSERLAKYNQILRIEEELGSTAEYAGRAFHKPL